MTAATTTRPSGVGSSGPGEIEIRQRSQGWKTFRTYAGVVLIIIWGLAPAYWMVVTAFRNVGFTFDTTPWPTHVTLDNFKTAFSTQDEHSWSVSSLKGPARLPG
jgi:multiple sugar transport system permease protein